MAMSTGGGSTGTLSEINVTPLVDVMLVLLVVFMVTAPMLNTGVEIDLPDAKARTIDDDEGKLVVQIKQNGEVWIDKLQLPPDKMTEMLKGNAKLQTEKEAYLRADKDTRYEQVVKVMAALQLAGVEKLGFVTDPLE